MLPKIFGIAVASLLAMSGAAVAGPITTLTPLTSNGTQMYAVYVSSDAGDTLNLSEIGPNPVANFLCNYSNSGCTASLVGQVIDLGITPPGIVFSLTDVTVTNTYRTDMLALDGYAHSKVSNTVDASDASAVAAAYAYFGQGPLAPAAAVSIALLGETPGTIITFVGWEDRIGGDFDYNDLIFAFTDPPNDPVPEPGTLAMFGLGFLGLAALRRRKLRA